MPNGANAGMTRREFIARGAGTLAGASLLGGLAKTAFGAEEAPRRKPNIVYVFADQMRAASMGCMGNKEIKTPNMDRMAKQGLLFTNAITSFPLCSPYRAMLLTGRYPLSTGVITNDLALPQNEITIAKVLKEQGYKTGYVGKWHLLGFGDELKDDGHPRQGFDFFATRGAVPEKLGADVKRVGIPDYKPDNETSLALDFIRRNAKEPFCLFLSWLPPHPPYGAPSKYEAMYDPSKLTQRPNVKGEDRRPQLAKYYAMISSLDENIGRLMDTLNELGIAEDTIFCFSSDHGDMLGSQDRMNKNLPYEESVNVPFIMRYPRKIKAGGNTDVLLSTTDIMPTLLGLCDAPIPKGVQGTDLSQIVLGKGGEGPESAYLIDVIPGPTGRHTGVDTWRGIRTKRYTYARWRDKGWVLFDNEKDPYQMNNLIDKPEAKEIQDKLDAQLQAWLKKTGDEFESMETWAKRKGIKLKAAGEGKPKKQAGKKGRRKARKKNAATN